jgi:hypothetical protein
MQKTYMPFCLYLPSNFFGDLKKQKKGVLFVGARALGHKRINNTQIYINLEQAIFSEGENSEYTTRIAKTVRAARVLLEAGFDFVTDMDGFKIFHKRK